MWDCGSGAGVTAAAVGVRPVAAMTRYALAFLGGALFVAAVVAVLAESEYRRAVSARVRKW